MIFALVLSMALSSQAAGKVDKVNIKNKTTAPSVQQDSVTENQDPSSTLANYFRENNCDGILKYFKGQDFLSLKPLELAIVAYCEPPGKHPEKMFTYAEKKDPKDDVILLLHGRYRWKKYKVNASEIWEKLSRQSQSEALVDLARQYLKGNGSEAEAGLNAKENQVGFVQLGSIYEANPGQLPKSDSQATKSGSDGLIWKIAASPKSEYEYGFINWNMTFSGTHYVSTPDSNLAILDFAPQLSLQSSLEQFFVVRPSTRAFSLDGRPFYGSVGISLGEIWLYSNLDLSVLATLSGDKYYLAGAEYQAGTHYMIEQKTNYHFRSSVLSLSLTWDKTNAGEDNSKAGQLIPYTNNSGIVSLGYQWTRKKLSLGMNSTMSIRQDEMETQYLDLSGVAQTKKRRDVAYNLGPWGSWKWTDRLTGIVFYSVTQVRSNMKEEDNFDRNIDNSVGGVILKSNF